MTERDIVKWLDQIAAPAPHEGFDPEERDRIRAACAQASFEIRRARKQDEINGQRIIDLERQLRVARGALENPPRFRDYTGTDYQTCGYCNRPIESADQHHDDDCPWVVATAALGSLVTVTRVREIVERVRHDVVFVGDDTTGEIVPDHHACAVLDALLAQLEAP